MGAATAALGVALFFVFRAWLGARKEVAEQKAQNAALRESVKARDRYAEKKEEIRNETEKKKESLHTGDDDADFDNSVKLLHGTRSDKPPAADT
jgi:hypothetical protein